MKQLLFGIMVVFLFLPGCQKDQDAGMSQEHKVLIAEFEKYKVRQCACIDFECTKALGQKIGPRIEEVMRTSEKLPTEVQLKLGSLLTQMTECAKRTAKP